jgi:hypothetical protein
MFSSFVPAPPPMPHHLSLPPLPHPVPLNAINLPGQMNGQPRKKTRRPTQPRQQQFNSQASQDGYTGNPLFSVSQISQSNDLSQNTFNDYGMVY